MGIAIGIVGALIALFGFVQGLSVQPNGAIQEAVQMLFMVMGSLGLLIFAGGCVVQSLSKLVDLLSRANEIAEKPTVKPVTSETLVETF